MPFSESRASGLTLLLVLTDFVRCETAAPPMSEMSQKATSGPGANASGLTSVREYTNGQVT